MLEKMAANTESYMTLLSEREKLIASNIANADTPGYRTRDINFEQAFRHAMGGTPEVTEVEGLRLNNDGNNVSIDREMRSLSETALRFNIASNFARSTMRQIKIAINDGGNS